MHQVEIEENSTSVVLLVFVEDTRLGDGGGLTGLTPSTSGLTAYSMRAGQEIPYCVAESSSAGGDTGPDQIALAESCTGDHVDGGFLEIDADLMPGLYELQIPDACVATGSHTCHIQLRGAANMAVTNIQVLIRSPITANITQISGDSAAADNMESTYDGTGYVDPVAPARQEQMDNLAIGSAAISVVASSRTLTTGSEVNSYTDTTTLNGISHEISDDGGTTDIYYEFDVGLDGVPVDCTVHVASTGKNDDINVFAWNWNSSVWEQIGSIAGAALATIVERQFNTVITHVGTGVDSGTVRIRFQNTGLTTATLHIDRIIVCFAVVNRSVGYAEGAIWVDTINGTAGTTAFINGTADLPVNSWTDALAISTTLRIKRFHIINGSSIVLSANTDHHTFLGTEWTLDLNGQSCEDASFEGAHVTGACTGVEVVFIDCDLATGGGTLTIAGSESKNCAIAGNIVLTAANSYFFDNCRSGIAGTATPNLDFGAAVGSTNLNFRHYSGGIEIENMGVTGTDTMSLEGHGQLIINANCSGGSIAIRGHFTITDNAEGAVTLNDDARLDIAQIENAVWEAASEDHGTQGTTGRALRKASVIPQIPYPHSNGGPS